MSQDDKQRCKDERVHSESASRVRSKGVPSISQFAARRRQNIFVFTRQSCRRFPPLALSFPLILNHFARSTVRLRKQTAAQNHHHSADQMSQRSQRSLGSESVTDQLTNQLTARGRCQRRFLLTNWAPAIVLRQIGPRQFFCDKLGPGNQLPAYC